MTEIDQNNKLCSSDKQAAWLPPFVSFVLPFLFVGGYCFFMHGVVRSPATFPNQAALEAYASECWTLFFIFGALAGVLGLLIYKFINRKALN